jgi:hypothetical protein
MVRQRHLQRIALLVDGIVGFVAAALVVAGIDVSASGEDECVDDLQHRLPARLARGDQHRHAAGTAHRVQILRRQRVAIVGAAAVGRQADKRMS